MEILLVSSDAAALGSAARPFTERGIALLHAGSLSQALDTLSEKKANPPALVILDESEDRGTGQGMRQAAMAVLRICPFTYLTALTRRSLGGIPRRHGRPRHAEAPFKEPHGKRRETTPLRSRYLHSPAGKKIKKFTQTVDRKRAFD